MEKFILRLKMTDGFSLSKTEEICQSQAEKEEKGMSIS